MMNKVKIAKRNPRGGLQNLFPQHPNPSVNNGSKNKRNITMWVLGFAKAVVHFQAHFCILLLYQKGEGCWRFCDSIDVMNVAINRNVI